MPMDGVMLGFVARELDSVLRDGRVDRVIQPEKDEIHLLIRAGGANHRLVLSASASAARAHLSSHAKTGPMEPPMLCMLLRKYLCGGRVLSVQRIAGDRILKIASRLEFKIRKIFEGLICIRSFWALTLGQKENTLRSHTARARAAFREDSTSLYSSETAESLSTSSQPASSLYFSETSSHPL